MRIEEWPCQLFLASKILGGNLAKSQNQFHMICFVLFQNVTLRLLLHLYHSFLFSLVFFFFQLWKRGKGTFSSIDDDVKKIGV
ncbi:hypothetical protein VNO77_28970 [Canavalia gladiata]|uniref:Uncharacterized protein n=1 Tax=Canavalia gladiata TaxID=3824 RepID=A0AAN9KWL4_CANGL